MKSKLPTSKDGYGQSWIEPSFKEPMPKNFMIATDDELEAFDKKYGTQWLATALNGGFGRITFGDKPKKDI